jgi:type IV pilus assembly protein PilB
MNSVPENDITHYLSADLAWRYKIIPHKIENNKLILLIDRNAYQNALTGELELITGYEITLIKEQTDIIDKLLSKLYRKDSKSIPSKVISTESGNKTDDFLQKIIYDAKDLKSSDIHIEGYSDRCRIRFRIDGKLIERYHIPKEQYSSFINKVKIKAGLDIAEKRLPQDGRILISENGNRIDIRVSVLPALYGEKIVLRLLSTDSSHITLENLGLDKKQLSDFHNTLKKPHGIILISGPTGSGKTTTLYATLKLLNNENNNILTVEDPIEYTLDGINQVQLKESIGLTFSTTLRTFLRQDPDIIMLGEIRDGETAQMAIRAALTGHLVLSTIHTNSAWGTVSRLVDMGVPTFLLAHTLNMTISQRLVRRLCQKCKKLSSFNKRDYPYIEKLIPETTEYYAPSGCDNCYYTGYIGRMAVYEVIPIDTELSLMIKENSLKIYSQLHERNITTLESRAIELLKMGETSLEEIYPFLINH